MIQTKNIIKYLLLLILGVIVTSAIYNNLRADWITFNGTLMTPYLQAVTANSVYVLIESDTDISSPITVQCQEKFGPVYTATSESAQKTTASPPTYIHNIKVSGLKPNTVYFYSVYQGVGSNGPYSFFTAAQPGGGFRFAWMADCRTGTGVHATIARQILSFYPRFSLYGGDLCYNSSYSSYKNEFFLYDELDLSARIPFFNAVGNHELWDTNTKAFTQDTSASGDQGYYSFDYGDTHFLVLNYKDPYWDSLSSSSAQYIFAKNDLQKTNQRWKVVACHAPTYCDDPVHLQGDATMKKLTKEIFEPNHVDLVLAGHSHYYMHSLKSGIHHMVIGAAGADLYTPNQGGTYTIKAERTNCYGILDETPTVLNLTVYKDDQSVLDSIPISGTVGDWKLDSNYNDQSPYKNNGVPTYGMFLTTVMNRKTAYFNGANNYIDIPNNTSFNNFKEFTLSAWINPASYSNAVNSTLTIISKVTPYPFYDFKLQLNNGYPGVYFGSESMLFQCVSSTRVNLNQWTHLAAVWTGTKWILYINGIKDKEVSISGGYQPPWQGTIMEIGAMNKSNCFKGAINEVKVFKYALSGSEIANLYNLGRP